MRIFAATIILLSTLIATPAHAAQEFLGLSPSSILEENLMRDVSFKQTVFLQRPDGSYAETIDVGLGGPDRRFLVGENEIFFDEGVKEMPYTFEILPKDAASGEYEAGIVFIQRGVDPVTGEGAGLAVLRGVALSIKFSVTDEEIIDYKISDTIVYKTEEKFPLSLEIVEQNDGNVEWRPEKIVVTLTDSITQEEKSFTFPREDLDIVSPGARIRQHLDVVHGLREGDYQLRVDVYYDGEIIYTHNGGLQILAAGTLKQEGVYTTLSTNKETFVPGENIKITGVFKNTGAIPVVAHMVVEIYSPDGELLDIILSSERSVGLAGELPFEVFTSLDASGDYNVISRIEYGNKVSDDRTMVISVVSAAAAIGEVNLLYPAVALLGALLLVILVIILLRRRRRVAAPVVTGPIAVGAAQVSGTAKVADGSLIELYINNQRVGQANVANGAWSIAVNPAQIVAGANIHAIARVDSNKDGAVNEKDKTSKASKKILVATAAPQAKPPTTPPSTTTRSQASEVKSVTTPSQTQATSQTTTAAAPPEVTPPVQSPKPPSASPAPLSAPDVPPTPPPVQTTAPQPQPLASEVKSTPSAPQTPPPASQSVAPPQSLNPPAAAQNEATTAADDDDWDISL